MRLPLTGRLIPIIADDHAEADFGSGAVKITAAHDFNDFEVAQRHPEANIPLDQPDEPRCDDVRRACPADVSAA